ncbi:MAG: helix-turn-helix domain-containing protein [Anaerolineae bacterium]|nr:helix-turn-helix domain-containing protein [Anaerolineae bacterium]MCO5194709.1 helix-turn-helix domain-containing protein [Anaerolineae bacterium]MCO5204869.1 helix-turn-helix domain-containing protein [Anaerolineae bacterium]
MDRFGEKLRNLRISSQLTLSQLATELGYKAHGYLSEIESGRKLPTTTFVLKVSRYFDVSTDELLKDELNLSSLDEN